MRKFFFFYILLLLTSSSFAQMQVSGIPMTIAGGSSSYNAMIQQLFGAGVSVSNFTINADTTQLQAGWFTANGTNLGLTQGLLLTSGDINGGPGPNTATNYTGAVTNRPGDADLNAQITGFTTNDACIIEFDIIPYCDTLSIKYVFGSDEYEEFVNSAFNDVFAFFITGPNPAGGNYVTQNIARIPNTTTAVSINNLNCNTNSTYYRCNSQNTIGMGGICNSSNCPTNNATTTLQYDGLTKVLDAKAAVVPCISYHVKIAVADGGGHLLDSGVFLQAGGVSCSSTMLSTNTITSAVEGCANGLFTFLLPSPLANPDTFIFQIAGTATPGLDYALNAIPDTLIIPAGATSGTISVPVFADAAIDGGETIQLIYSDTALCGTQIVVDTFTMYILDAPAINAGPDKVICSGDTVAIGVSAAFGHSYHWTPTTNIVSGTSNQATAWVSLINNTAAPYSVNFTFTDSAGTTGCVSTDIVNVLVNPKPIASFNAPNVCYGTSASFTNTSTPNIAASIWNFGDGATSNLTNATHLYSAGGNYNVQLITVTSAGCLDTLSQAITIYSKPVADFSAAGVCLHSPSQLIDNSVTATQWAWNLGNGNTFSTQNVNFTYTSAGTYQAQLIITDVQGCKDTVTKPVQVYALPTANFTVQNKCVYDNFSFQNLSIQGTNVLNNYSWNFGDTQSSNVSSPTNLYGTSGTYTVTFIATDATNCADTIQKTVDVYPQPNADFTVANACQGDTISFLNNSTILTGTILSNHWNFGDSQSANLSNPTHIYANSGNFNVELLVKSDHNCRDSVTKPIAIFPKPSSNFTVAPVCLGETSIFTDNSVVTNPLQNDVIVAWNWDFADGTSTNFPNTTHVYLTEGNYPVVLSTTTDKGCTSSITKTAVVHPLPETPAIKNDSTCLGGDFVFLVLSPINIQVKWFHNLTDSLAFYTGNQYSVQSVFENKSFFVQAVNPLTGCKTPKIAIDGIVYPESNQSILCLDSVVFLPSAIVSFSVNSDIPLVNYSWNFGDKDFSYSPNPVHQYEYAHIFPVNVTTTDIHGCNQTLTKNVEVKEVYGVHVPSAFTPNGDGGNDDFFVGAYQISKFHIEIYNRWGELIFSSDDPNFRWDGKTKEGKDCPEGVYVFKIKAISTNNQIIEKSGTITLIR